MVKDRLGLAVVLIVILLTALCALSLSGCGSLDKEFVERMDSPATILFPDLKKVYRGEPLDLTAEQRARRLKLLEEWEKTILEAKKATK